MRARLIAVWWRGRPWLEKAAVMALAALLLAYSFGGRSGTLVGLLELACVVLGGMAAFHWVRVWVRALMWRLRHRLIVTYVFIGVVPVLLLLAMAALAAWIFYGQIASYIVNNSINRLQEEMLIATRSAARYLAAAPGDPEGVLRTNLPPEAAEVPFEAATVRERPPWIKDEFHGLVETSTGPALRSAVALKSGMLVTTVPISSELLSRIAAGIGEIALASGTLPSDPAAASNQLPRLVGRGIKGGALPPPNGRFDYELGWGLSLPKTNWETGEEAGSATFAVTSRPSLLNTQLFSTLGILSRTPLTMLAVIGFIFLIIEILSLFVGVRLTRTMTRAVADLYEGTARIHAGNFGWRIPVRSSDQLAALAGSFNTMTSSLEKLILEQKEKQRMQSELEIARDVQAQLFPKELPAMERLEVAARCNPARTVSGDYYDLLEVDGQHLGLVLGDIAGKGISAALLMASIQSMLHAQFSLFHARAAGEGFPAGEATREGSYKTAALVSQLNRQLHQNIAPGHFATFFCAFYNDVTGELTYTNAGHLPPLILRKGQVLRLEKGGIVLGIFPQADYEQETLRLEHGDLLVAYTDGITEPENSYGEEFGEHRLFDLLKHSVHLPPAQLIDTVMTAVREWTASPEQPDDMTLLVARRR